MASLADTIFLCSKMAQLLFVNPLQPIPIPFSLHRDDKSTVPYQLSNVVMEFELTIKRLRLDVEVSLVIKGFNSKLLSGAIDVRVIITFSSTSCKQPSPFTMLLMWSSLTRSAISFANYVVAIPRWKID